MADLIAQGVEPQFRWRRTLTEERSFLLGRDCGAWSTPWDNHVSRAHARARWRENRLEVEKLPDATNPVFHQGQSQVRFSIRPDEHFVIGDTTFTLTNEHAAPTLDSPLPASEQSFSAQYLKRVRFRNADQRIAVLAKLPEIVSKAASDTELFVQLVNVMLIGVPRATAAALVAVRAGESDKSRIDVLHWDRRLLSGVNFEPSERLIRQAVDSGESVVHVWRSSSDDRDAFTVSEDVDWAFATPVRGEACVGWAIYMSGSFAGSAETAGAQPSNPEDFRDDLKFTELAATTLGSLQDVRRLERSHASLSQFFSPVVMEALAEQDADAVLAPREADVSVLFCDLRGFSRKAEQMADDLFGLLNRVSGALGVTTHHILDQGGVVGDFHGDSAMGFWGWPLAQEDSAVRACQAALAIRDELERAAAQDGHPLADFRMGVGIASGRAVAGRIGTVDQVKVTVFGPVVNLASRLEGMTDIIRAPILMDEATAKAVRESASRDAARVRRVAIVKPYGLAAAVEVSELLPPASRFPGMTDDDIAAYEAALGALLGGDWDEAFRLLHAVPAEDRVKDFLTVFIASHNRTPPENWDGVIPLGAK